MALGENILVAQPQTEQTDLQKGTSLSAPIVTDITALLMSLKLQQGKPIDAEAIRAALLNTAIPCTSESTEEPERCLRGKLNLPEVMNLLFELPSVTISFTGDRVTRVDEGHLIAASSKSEELNNLSDKSDLPATSPSNVSSLTASVVSNPPVPKSASIGRIEFSSPSHSEAQITPSSSTLSPAAVTPSTAHTGQIYALGTLGYDFGSEARRDSFKQLIPLLSLSENSTTIEQVDE